MTRAMLLAVCLAAVPAAAARAQNAAPPAVAPASPAQPGATNTPPEQIAPPLQPGTGADITGADTKGVITPPSVDPGIAAKAPVPAPNTMKVIPPPGTPGGNPNVVPK